MNEKTYYEDLKYFSMMSFYPFGPDSDVTAELDFSL